MRDDLNIHLDGEAVPHKYPSPLWGRWSPQVSLSLSVGAQNILDLHLCSEGSEVVYCAVLDLLSGAKIHEQQTPTVSLPTKLEGKL